MDTGIFFAFTTIPFVCCLDLLRSNSSYFLQTNTYRLIHTDMCTLTASKGMVHFYLILSLLPESNQREPVPKVGTVLRPELPITEMLCPISTFTYHILGDIELPMPRPARHGSEPAQLLFILTNNLVMKY